MMEHYYKIHELIRAHEGYRRHVYRCTAGKLTVGIGLNLEDDGLDEFEALWLLDRRIQQCRFDLYRIFGSAFDQLTEARQHVLIDMRYNLGPSRFRSFKRMIAAIGAREYDVAVREMLDSKYAREDVPTRAEHNAELFLRGVYPDT